MPRKIKKVNRKEQDDSKLFAFLAAFLSILGFVIALVAKKDNKYVMFYAKQSLVVFITAVIAWIVSWIVLLIPILGHAINIGLNIIVFILWLISWIYALSGGEKEVPIVGKYARNFKF